MLFVICLLMSPNISSKKPTTPEALLLLEGWLLENKTTRSSEVVRGVLLSLAGARGVDLSELRLLDDTRREWLSEIMRSLPLFDDKDLVRIAWAGL
jgi:hypothetical protein